MKLRKLLGVLETKHHGHHTEGLKARRVRVSPLLATYIPQNPPPQGLAHRFKFASEAAAKLPNAIKRQPTARSGSLGRE